MCWRGRGEDRIGGDKSVNENSAGLMHVTRKDLWDGSDGGGRT